MRGFRSPSDKRPLVLLLGWLGSKHQHLNKYTRMWQDLGAQVIPHQPSILQTAMPSAQDKALLRFMKDFNYLYSSLCTVRGDTPPVLVHTMSNAGFIAFGTMLHLVSLLSSPIAAPAASGESPRLVFDPTQMAAAGGLTARSYGLWGGEGRGRRRMAGGDGEHPFATDPPAMAVLSAFRQVLRNTQGIIIDSAPSQATPSIWSKGFLSAVFSEAAQDVAESHPLLLRGTHALAERYLSLPHVVKRIREIRHAWQYRVPPCPQLYLYSEADALIPYHHVELFMQQQAAHGIPVHHHRWVDSAHCEHLRKHPQQYTNLCRSFSEFCLHSHTSPEVWV